MAWIPIPGTDHFSEDGKGVYEKMGMSADHYHLFEWMKEDKG